MQNSIFMRQTIPTKLTVPFTNDFKMEVTVHGDQTVADFEKKVVDGSQGMLKNFQVTRTDLADKENFQESTTMASLKSSKFNMVVNGKKFDVYPDLASITKRDQITGIQSLFTESAQVDVPRQIVLSEY